MNALLNKFQKVTLKTTSLIPSEDKTALDQLHRQYEDAMEQLDEWRLFFEAENNKAPMPGFQFKATTDWRNISTVNVHTSPVDTDPFAHLKFFVGYPLVDIDKKMKEVRAKYISRSFQYFADKYSLLINFNDELLIRAKALTYLDVVESIRKQFGGLNFNAIAKTQITDRFRGHLPLRDRVNLANKNIELVSYLSMDSGHKCYRDNKTIQHLEDAVMLFERGHAEKGAMFLAQNFFDGYIDFTQDYTFINCDKLEGIRFYMNRKTILKFKTAAIAKEFYEYFDLASLPLSRW